MRPREEVIRELVQQWLDKKTFLTTYQVEFPKTHDLAELLDLVATIDQRLSSALAEITKLTVYGVAVRYPGESPEVTTDEARTAVSLARKVRTEVCALLEGKFRK
jgi:HEPN domain-containing protein